MRLVPAASFSSSRNRNTFPATFATSTTEMLQKFASASRRLDCRRSKKSENAIRERRIILVLLFAKSTKNLLQLLGLSPVLFGFRREFLRIRDESRGA